LLLLLLHLGRVLVSQPHRALDLDLGYMMSSRQPARFDEQSGRRSGEPRESRTTREPRESRERERDSRESRDPREFRDSRESRDLRDTRARDGREVISPREVVSPRDVISPRDVMPRPNMSPPQGRDTREARIDPRAPQPRIEPSRIDSRTDPRIDPRQDPTLMPGGFREDIHMEPRGDVRTGSQDPRGFPGYRGDQMMNDRYTNPREIRDSREQRDMYGDGMDIDQPSTGRLIIYELDATGISREVIQADICRYLGPDATCMFKAGLVSFSSIYIHRDIMLTRK
jgi:hypothetical protein